MKELFVRIRPLLVFILFVSLLAPGLSYAANVAAEVIRIKGDVFIQRKSERISLKLNQKLFENDVVQTGSSGRVKIRLKEGDNEIVLGGDTELKIERVGQKTANTSGTVLGLNKGSVRSNVRKKYSGKGKDVYQVKTPNAVAGVRGTVFMVSFSPRSQESLIATERGAVAWRSRGAEVLVAKGMFASVVGQRMSSLKSIKSSPELIKKINEVRRDSGENALPVDAGESELSPNSVKAEPKVRGVKREEVSRVEFDEKGNTVVVVEDERDLSKLKRGPASIGVGGGDSASANSRPTQASPTRNKNMIRVPTIRTDLVRKNDVAGVVKPSMNVDGSRFNEVEKDRNVVADQETKVPTDSAAVKPEYSNKRGTDIVQSDRLSRFNNTIKDSASGTFIGGGTVAPRARESTATIVIGPPRSGVNDN